SLEESLNFADGRETVRPDRGGASESRPGPAGSPVPGASSIIRTVRLAESATVADRRTVWQAALGACDRYASCRLPCLLRERPSSSLPTGLVRKSVNPVARP